MCLSSIHACLLMGSFLWRPTSIIQSCCGFMIEIAMHCSEDEISQSFILIPQFLYAFFWLSVLQWYLRLKEEGMNISFKCWSSGSCAIIISIEVDWKESLLCVCLIILIIWCVEPLTMHLERSSRAAELKPKWGTLALSLVTERAWTGCKARNTRSHT